MAMCYQTKCMHHSSTPTCCAVCICCRCVLPARPVRTLWRESKVGGPICVTFQHVVCVQVSKEEEELMRQRLKVRPQLPQELELSRVCWHVGCMRLYTRLDLLS